MPFFGQVLGRIVDETDRASRCQAPMPLRNVCRAVRTDVADDARQVFLGIPFQLARQLCNELREPLSPVNFALCMAASRSRGTRKRRCGNREHHIRLPRKRPRPPVRSIPVPVTRSSICNGDQSSNRQRLPHAPQTVCIALG